MLNLYNFDYAKLTLCLKNLTAQYPFLKMFSVGKSVMQRDIWCIKVGKGNKKILVIAAHHGLEWITSALAVGFVRDFSYCLRNNMVFEDEMAYDIYSRGEYYIIPMLNPDGVDIVINSIDKSHPFFESVNSIASPDRIPYLWQANIRGVDLNHNYDCRFQEGVILAQKEGITAPHYTRFSGNHPFSEPETLSIKDLCEKTVFHSSLAFHTQGEVIYPGNWMDKKYISVSKALSDVSGYELSVAQGVADCSGFKDWMMDKLNIPSFTIEFGMGKNPLPFSQFEKMKKPCYNVMKEISKH